MSYDNQNSRMVVLDLETVAIDDVADYVEPAEPAANLKDPQKIADDIAKKERAQIEKAALYPWTARIVALGAWVVGADTPRVRVTLHEASEAEALAALWDTVVSRSGAVSPLVTFNGLGFDLPVLMARSRLLGVQAPVLNTDRYRSPHPDLMQILTFRGAVPSRSLKWFARRFGVLVDDETSGADVAALVAAGDVQAVADHCESDVRLTHALAVRLGVISVVAAKSVA